MPYARPVARTLPTVRLPATVQTALGTLAVERYPAWLLRRFAGEPLVAMRLLGIGRLVSVGRPDAIREVFTGDHAVLCAGAGNRRILGHALGRTSVLLLDGAEHLRMRRILLPSFHGAALRAHEAVVEEVARANVARWPRGGVVRTADRMQEITLEVMLRAVLGVADPARRARLHAALAGMLAVNPAATVLEGRVPRVARRPAFRRLPWIRARSEARRLLLEEIAARRADPGGGDDVLAALLRADAGERPLTDEEVLDQLVTLLLAGHETTAATLAFAFERLVHHPDALQRLRAELDAAGPGDPTPYLDAVVQEVLRTRPVLEVAWRVLACPCSIAGRELPAGTLLAVAIRGVQRGPEHPRPRAFRPERFLDGGVAPSAFVPFGGWPRRCLGASFALMELRVVLRAVLTAVDLEAAGRPERQSRLQRFALVPARGGRVRVVARRGAASPTGG